MSDKRRELILATELLRNNAYAPYSRFKVGAAFRLADGRIVGGVNVENCTYGLTVCAERNAVAQLVAQGISSSELLELAVVTDAIEPAPPCGACRQVLAEIIDFEMPIILYSSRNSKQIVTYLRDLLPEPFLPASLIDAVNLGGD